MWTFILIKFSCFFLTHAYYIPNENGDLKNALDGCPVGWVNAQSLGCFKFLATSRNVTWFEAHNLCELQGGYLAEPTVAEQMEFLSGLAFMEQEFTGITHWWIGLSDFSHEGTWVWSHTSEEANKMFWDNGSPHSSTGNKEDCVFMEFKHESLNWIDGDCSIISYTSFEVFHPPPFR